jgi:hypothetical protein
MNGVEAVGGAIFITIAICFFVVGLLGDDPNRIPADKMVYKYIKMLARLWALVVLLLATGTSVYAVFKFIMRVVEL